MQCPSRPLCLVLVPMLGYKLWIRAGSVLLGGQSCSLAPHWPVCVSLHLYFYVSRPQWRMSRSGVRMPLLMSHTN